MRQEWRTDYSSLLDPHTDRPSPSDLAADNPGTGPGYDAGERAELVARVVELQAGANQDRCWNHYCRTSLDIDDWPPTVRDCGHPICDRCVTCDECDRGAA